MSMKYWSDNNSFATIPVIVCVFSHRVAASTMSTEVSDKLTFSFKDKVLQLHLEDNVFIRMERVGSAVARLIFVDEKFVECNIPSGISVSDETHRGANVRPLLNNQFFVLAWSNN